MQSGVGGKFKREETYVGSGGKESACNAETSVRSLGLEDALEEGMATHYSILVWRTPWTVEPGGLHFMGLQ